MKLEIAKGTGFLLVTKEEAIQLVQSITNQILAGNPNVGRLESHCKGAVNEFTLMVLENE